MKSDELQFKLSLGVPDVRRYMTTYARMLVNADMPLTEEESSLRWWLVHDNAVFGTFPVKYADDLASWCIATALRHGIITQSAGSKTTYLFPEPPRPPGRPRKE